jgi:hypothetical protein
MSKPIALTKITVYQEDTANRIRKAYIDGFDDPMYFGVTEGLKTSMEWNQRFSILQH